MVVKRGTNDREIPPGGPALRGPGDPALSLNNMDNGATNGCAWTRSALCRCRAAFTLELPVQLETQCPVKRGSVAVPTRKGRHDQSPESVAA